jgi:acyl-CoA reductase-like NAD-dependent aldehyde dehydrogenase
VGGGWALAQPGALYRWAEHTEAEPENLAPLLSRENGKPLSEPKVELAAAVDTVRLAAGQTRRLEGRSLTVGSSTASPGATSRSFERHLSLQEGFEG